MQHSDRFWSRVSKTETCWIWLGPKHRQGYGRVGFKGNRAAYAHRVSYELTHGPIPTGMFVLHGCDNPPCVRPDHLRLGTQKENAADMHSRGRANRPLGSRATHSRLTETQARRAKYGQEKLAPLSRELGVSYQALYEIRNGRTWRHI